MTTTTYALTDFLPSMRPATVAAPAPAPELAPVSLLRKTGVDELRRRIAANPGAPLSFDCFDTLLWRNVPKPTDVFLALGHRLADLGLLASGATPQLFARLRVLGEQVARRQSKLSRGSSEVGFDQIYAYAGFRRYTSCSAAQLTQHELVMEARMTSSDPAVQALLREVMAQEPERPVLVISNTYLDEQQLRRLLASSGYDFLDRAHFFVSSEHGVAKAEGLIGKAYRELGLDPARCIHVGNNAEDDVRNAAAIGAGTSYLPEFSPMTSRAMSVEGWLSPRQEAGPLLDPRSGDSGLAALRGRVSQHRPEGLSREEELFWEVGAATLGPALTGYAEWVHQRAGELGIGSVLCLMREGRLLAELIEAVPNDQRTCRALPFWASRSACLRATFTTGDLADISRVLWSTGSMSPRQILRALDLRPEELPGGAAYVAGVEAMGSGPEVGQALLSFLSSKPYLRELIVQRSTARRKAYVAYLLRSLERAGAQTVGLVDLGFGGTIQEWLHQMVQLEAADIDFHGLYLFTSPRALPRQLGGHRMDGFLVDAGARHSDSVVLNRSPEILETLTTCSEGSLLEISPSGEPVLGPSSASARQNRLRQVLQHGVMGFQQLWQEFQRGSSFADRRALREQSGVLRHILESFVAEPGAEVAEALGGLAFEPNMGSEESGALVPAAIRERAAHLAPEHLATLPTEELNWVGAAAALRGAERQVALLQREESALGASLDMTRWVFAIALADSRGVELGSMQAQVRLNERARGLLDWQGTVAGARSVVLSVGGLDDGAAVVRFDRVRLATSLGAAVQADFSAVDDPSVVIEVSRTIPSGAPAAHAFTAGSSVRFTLPDALPGDIVGFEIAYGFLGL